MQPLGKQLFRSDKRLLDAARFKRHTSETRREQRSLATSLSIDQARLLLTETTFCRDTMPGRRVDTEMLEGISVEWFEAASHDAILALWTETKRIHQRKSAPLNRLLPHTLLWANELPSDVVPVATMNQFPRVANLLAANWKEQAAFQNYMQSLLIDRRGSRQGFAVEIKEELIRLRTYYYLGMSGKSTIVESDAATDSASTKR